MNHEPSTVRTGRPYRSKLKPHFGLITAMRAQEATWQEIADKITALGVKTQGHAVCEFFQRHRRRPLPIGFTQAGTALRTKDEAGASSEKEGRSDDDFLSSAESAPASPWGPAVKP